MQQEADNKGGVGGGSGGSGGDRKMKILQQDGQPAHLQQPPQKCPRCDSFNTKFCYYNNYSLSQPRYFCKTCRRYWTQGGTLRNVPVGGGCRKGKRPKTASSATSGAESTSRVPPSQPPAQDAIQTPPNVTPITSESVVRAKEPSQPLAPMGAYYGGGGGYFSSLTAIQSLNPSQPFNQPMNVGGDVVGSNSNLGLLAGFNILGSLQQQHQSLFPAEHGLIQTSMASTTAAPEWPQGFINNASHGASDASLWSTISTASISGNSQSNANGTGSSSLMPNQWPHLPGYGPPP